MGCGMEAKCSPTTRPKLIFEIIFADIKSLFSIAAIPANQEKKKRKKNNKPIPIALKIIVMALKHVK